MTAADVLWGQALGWGMKFGLLPENKIIATYCQRPAALRVVAMDEELAAVHEKAVN